jgi:hypothetical protein
MRSASDRDAPSERAAARRALAAGEQGLDLANRPVVALEGLAGVFEKAGFLRVRRVLVQADQARTQAVSPLVPGIDEARR